ncbi:MAG TPA: F0F1 ATP synthase subunit delta [Thermoleophilia bacterium]|nr:F0F1 ATP synthase subunit delta [Thermoleophilia bacterium]
MGEVETRIARVYARALFEAARDAGRIEPVGRELGDFVAALAAAPELRHVLADPMVSEEAKRRVLAELTQGAEPLVAGALQVLQRKGRLAVVAEVSDEFAALAAAEERIVKVDVTSAIELPDEAERRLAEKIAGATGRRVEMTKHVDAGVLGGLVVRVGDVIVDGSLRARIRQLRRRLVAAEVRGDAK